MTDNKSRFGIALLVALGLGMGGCGKFGSSGDELGKAKTALQAKDLKSAELHLKSAIQKADSAEARQLLGGIYRDAADNKAAETEFRRAIELGSDRNEVVPLLLEALFNAGEFQKLIDDARNLAVDQPGAKAATATWIGRAYLSLGKFTEARAAFSEALTAVPGHIPAQAGMASILAAKGDKAGAQQMVDNLLAKDPKSPDAGMLKADMMLLDGKLVEAREMLSTIIASNPASVLARAKLTAIEIDLRNFDSARAQWRELAKINGGSPGTTYLKALIEFRDNKMDAAREAMQFALKVAPDFVPTLTLAANIYLATGAYEQAEKHARMVLERTPGSVPALRLLGAIYIKMNAPERALQAVQPLLDKQVEDAAVYAIAGEAALKLNDATKAAQYFDRASKLDPNDPSKRTGLALARMASGNQASAFAELEQAVEIDTKNYQADFALIMARVREKQYDKAIEAVDRLDKKLPQSPLPANLRGMVNLAKGDAPAARSAFEKSLQADPTFFAAAANLANLDLRDNKPDEARKRYEALLAKDPKNAQALISLANINARTGGNRDTTLEYLKRAKTASPGSVSAVLALANFHMEGRQPREAIAIIQEGLGANPNRLELLDVMGSAYLQLGDRQQAMDTFDKMLKVNPSSAALHYRMGEMRAAIRDDTGALQAFRRAAELQPKALEPKIAIASILLRQGKLGEARAVASGLQKDLGNTAAGLTLEGDLLAFEAKWNEALPFYKKAFEQEKSIAVGVKLHQAYFRSGKTAEAENFLADWIKQSPKDMSLRLYAGEHEIARERWSEAIKHYDLVLKADPKHAAALNNTAWCLNKLKDPRAVSVAEQAYALAPQSPPIIDTLGVLLMDSGNSSRGMELLKQAVSLAPRVAEYRLHLAEALIKGGDKGAARKELELILKDNPKGPAADAAKALVTKL